MNNNNKSDPRPPMLKYNSTKKQIRNYEKALKAWEARQAAKQRKKEENNAAAAAAAESAEIEGVNYVIRNGLRFNRANQETSNSIRRRIAPQPFGPQATGVFPPVEGIEFVRVDDQIFERLAAARENNERQNQERYYQQQLQERRWSPVRRIHQTEHRPSDYNRSLFHTMAQTLGARPRHTRRNRRTSRKTRRMNRK